jgi:hypothetical protein
MLEPITYPGNWFPGTGRLSDLPFTVVCVRGQVALAKQRQHTMTTVAATLAVSGQVAYASAKEDGGEWTVTIGALPDDIRGDNR